MQDVVPGTLTLRPKKKGRQKALDTNTPNGKILSRFEKEDTDTSIEHFIHRFPIRKLLQIQPNSSIMK